MKNLWQKISFIGLSLDEEFSKREIVLMNKLVFLSSFLMISFIPLEILINGWDLVWIEFVISLMCVSALYFNYLRKFVFAKFYFYVLASAIIFFLGIGIGKGSANELFFFPTFIFPAMLFNNRTTIIILSTIAFLLFCLQVYLMDIVPPNIYVRPEIKQTIRYFFFIIVFLIVFFEIYYFKLLNLKFQNLLEHSKHEIEEKNQEIIDSITYAKRIQEAILPSAEFVKESIPDSFVLYKPKDIVAGDFFWVEKEHGRIYVAAADCTGHGVPGAMVSVVCNTALNSSLREYKCISPAEILNQSRKLIVNQFNKNGADVKDGMDISLVSIHPENNNQVLIEWSGANNPIWYIPAGEKEIVEIKGDKQAVGKSELNNAFTNHTVTLLKGSTIYLCSDGFADQFGSKLNEAKGKKYKSKNLKKYLETITLLPLNEQMESLNQEFENWRGDLEQVDDICIIGIRI